MARPGWLKLWRSLQGSRVWQAKPFSPGQAWVDLLMRANYSDSVIKDPVRMANIPIRPGQIVCSLRQLSVDWGWSRNKLARYLGWLSNDTTIGITHGATYTIINILNWNKYQGDDAADDTSVGATRGATDGAKVEPPTEPVSEPHSDTIRRIKEGKEEKEGKEHSLSARNGSVEGHIVSAWNRGPGFPISHPQGQKLVRAYIDSGVTAQVQLEAVSNQPACKGKKFWEVIEPLRPANGEAVPSMDEILKNWASKESKKEKMG